MRPAAPSAGLSVSPGQSFAKQLSIFFGGGGGGTPPPFSDWAKSFSGPSANQKISLASLTTQGLLGGEIPPQDSIRGDSPPQPPLQPLWTPPPPSAKLCTWPLIPARSPPDKRAQRCAAGVEVGEGEVNHKCRGDAVKELMFFVLPNRRWTHGRWMSSTALGGQPPTVGQ